MICTVQSLLHLSPNCYWPNSSDAFAARTVGHCRLLWCTRSRPMKGGTWLGYLMEFGILYLWQTKLFCIFVFFQYSSWLRWLTFILSAPSSLHVGLLFSVIGPIPWGHSGPLCHALSSSSLWTSHATYAIAIAGVWLATPGDWQCNGGLQWRMGQHFSNASCFMLNG